MAKFGDKEISKKYDLGGRYMKLEEGPNKVRIVTEFQDYGTHSIEGTDKTGKRTFRTVVCIGKENCRYCREGGKSKVQFLGWVIDRATGSFKLMKIGYKIWQQLGGLANSEQYGFESTPSYDITITREGKDLNTTYTVMPDRKDTPITKLEQEQIDNLDSIEEIIEKDKAKEQEAAGVAEMDDVFGPDKEDIDVEEIPF
jgi:hypothetical protein